MIPIRQAIKKNVTTKDIISPIIEKGLSIPVTPAAVILFIMGPKDVGVGSDYIPLPPNPMITEGWQPYIPEHLNIDKIGARFEQDNCQPRK